MLTLETLAREAVEHPRAMRKLKKYLEKIKQQRLDHEMTIEAARANYAEPSNDDIEMDQEPLISVSPDGVWVSAWVYVPITD